MFRMPKPIQERPLILHLVTWYPESEHDIHGIFTRRHIELLADESIYRHSIVQHSKEPLGIIKVLKSIIGLPLRKKIGRCEVIQLPNQVSYNRRVFGSLQQQLWNLQLKRLIQQLQPSLLHLHVVYGFAKEAMAIHQQWGIPFIISEHMAPFPFEWIQDKERYIRQPMQKASAVVAVGKAQAEQIKNFTGVTAHVIPNVVNPGEFFYKGKAFKSEALQIVLVGIYDERKGADYLLQTFSLFLQSHPGTILHLVGEATEERMKTIMQIIRSSGIEGSVHFHGKLSAPQLCALYHQCDFYVCSSEWESFGVSVLEALFAGVPVLATNCGGVLEFMNEQNGIVIENDRKTQTLFNGMLQITSMLGIFNRQQISEEAIHKFSGDAVKEQYFSLYQQVLESAANQ